MNNINTYSVKSKLIYLHKKTLPSNAKNPDLQLRMIETWTKVVTKLKLVKKNVVPLTEI